MLLPFRFEGLYGRRLNIGGVPKIDWKNPLAYQLGALWVTMGGCQWELVNNVPGTDYTGVAPLAGPWGEHTNCNAGGIDFPGARGILTDNGAGTGGFSFFVLAHPPPVSPPAGTTWMDGAGTGSINVGLRANCNSFDNALGGYHFYVFDGTTYLA